jgi:UDP-glucose 4-epimerase
MIGSELLVNLAEHNGAENVVGLDLNFGGLEKKLGSLHLLQADVASSDISEVLSSVDADCVIHAAAHPGGKSLHEAAEDARVNSLGSMRVFEWCTEHKKKVVFLSSSIVYGDQEANPIPEDAKLSPGTIYGVSKVACERWLDILARGRGLDWVTLRLFSTYGRGHAPSTIQGIVNVFLTQLRQGDKVIIRGSLERIRDLVYVSDVVTAIRLATERWPSRRIINVCTGHGISISGILEHLFSALGKPQGSVQVEQVAGTLGDPDYNVGNPALAQEALGFRSQISLEEGLTALLSPQ